MARWRDVKSGKNKHKQPQQKAKQTATVSLKNGDIAPNPLKLKAFVVDMFMIMMPIMYILTYGILDGKNDFLGNDFAHLMSTVSYGIIISIFLAVSGQTPGMRAYEIKLVDTNTKQKLSFIRAFFRYVLFLFSATILFGIILALFRKDNKTLHDILSKSVVINHKNDKSA